jgi:carbon monoxide dehydrogenase subunit G
MAAASTCSCGACSNIGALDLKFVIHRGSFLDSGDDVAGPDVILVHRLLKNRVPERAYALFTEPCRSDLPRALPLREHLETYEELGDVRVGVYDLRPVLEGRRAAPAVYIGPEDADLEFAGEGEAPPAVLWPYFLDVDKRLRWEDDIVSVRYDTNERGRLGLGAVSHCDHGSWSSAQRFVDWRPFAYYTVDLQPVRKSLTGAVPMTITIELVPLEGGRTRVAYRFRLHDRGLLSRLMLRVLAPSLRRTMARQARQLNAVVREDLAAAGETEELR